MPAKTFFESVRNAAQDVERCRALLATMEQRAQSIAGASFESRVRTSASDSMGRQVAAYVDREARLHRRIESDYALIDLAHAVLYGSESLDDGLAALAPPWWADVLALHYCDLMTWAEVAAVVSYSASYVRLTANAALDLLDAHGLTDSVAGRGFAQDDCNAATHPYGVGILTMGDAATLHPVG